MPWEEGEGKGALLERYFHLSAAGTTIRTEVLAGLTTFMTMSYILFVQPAVLSTTGMDFQAVLAATCKLSGLFLSPLRRGCVYDAESRPDCLGRSSRIPSGFYYYLLIPFTFSITDGIAFGFIAYVVLAFASGRARKLHWLMVLFTLFFIVRYVALRGV
jgi:xanthine/uracil/vitamin C permease (AzgA family)